MCQCILAQEYLPSDIPHCAKTQQDISLILFAWIAGHRLLLQCSGHQRRSSCQKHGMAFQISLNEGRYVIRPFECKIIGTAEGCERVRASIHTLLTAFDDEEWRIITLVVNHLNSHLKYIDLFAASCGSIGEFTDISAG